MKNNHSRQPSSESKMRQLISAKDWSETLLGAMEEWPQSLHSALNMCLASNSPVSICWGDDYLFLYNDAWKDLLGKEHPSPLGKPASTVFEDSWQTFNSCLSRVSTTKQVVESKNQLISFAGGEKYFLNFSFSPIPGENGSVGGIFCIATEASGQKLKRSFDRTTPQLPGQKLKDKINKSNNSIAEQKQQELTNALLGAIVEGSDDAIISKDLNSIITSWNPGAERIFGYTAEEAIGQPITMLFPEDRLDEEEEIISRIRRGERIDHYETKRKRKDGILLNVSLTISPIKDSEGNIVGASKIARDVTKRKEADLKDAWLSAIVECSDDAIISKDLNSIITSWNAGAERIFGYTEGEAIGQPITMLFPEDRLDEEEEIISRIRRGERVEHFETKRKRKDGTLRDISLTISPIKNSEGNIVGASKIARDVTKRKEAEEKLEVLNETLEERVKERTKKLRSYQEQLRSLASKLNKAEERERRRLASELHDKLGQMLTVAKMKVDGLHHGQLFDDPSTDLEDLKKVVEDALKYNQNLMAELKPPPVLNKEDVTEVLKWTAKNMRKQGLDIVIEDDEQPKPVTKEIQTVLHQSVRELLQNVKKHSDADEARIIISRVKGRVKVTVEDKGKGFDLEETRLTPANRGKFGLFNIQERMDWHGGKFRIHSEPGKGTKATLISPLKEEEIHDPPSGDEEMYSPDVKKEGQGELWQKIKVLLVDDHDMVRRGLRQMITKENDLTIVAEASNGQEAVELASKTSPDVIIMDVNMPVMDGIEATEKIKATMPSVRVIGLSLHDSAEVIQDIKSAGASDYLAKNEAFETLCATIRREMPGK